MRFIACFITSAEIASQEVMSDSPPVQSSQKASFFLQDNSPVRKSPSPTPSPVYMHHTTEERRVDISDTVHFIKTKGNETPDEMDIGVESLLKEPDPRTETQATSASTMELASLKLQNAFKHKKNQVQKLEEQLTRMKEEAGDMEYHVQSLKHQMQWQIETAQKQVEAADEKVHKYETEIRELKDERDQLRQKYYDQLSSGNDELLEAVAKSLKGLRTLESELQWIGEKAEEQKMAIVSSKSCPLFKLD